MPAGALQAGQFTDCDATWKQLEREPEERLFALLDRMAPAPAAVSSWTAAT
ncbi:hypothetical protein ABT040_40160 [Streptomyces sp. NPDC002688]|uniref:hypothetical protein n=1 Tax=Streptomyces sp. NPDC002688 TaxID=3154423 RepID=UPI003324DEEE